MTIQVGDWVTYKRGPWVLMGAITDIDDIDPSVEVIFYVNSDREKVRRSQILEVRSPQEGA